MDKIRDSIIPVNGQRCSILVICISSKVGDEASEELIGYNTPIVALTTAAYRNNRVVDFIHCEGNDNRLCHLMVVIGGIASCSYDLLLIAPFRSDLCR